MKNTFKKLTAGAAVVAMLSAGAVFAEEVELISEEPAADVQTNQAHVDNALAIVEPFVTAFEEIDGVTMLPVRAVAEHFGFSVEWDEESQSVTLTRGAVYVMFSIEENSYSFSKMMPQQLEMAPVLVNGDTTYVPASLFTDILNLNIREAEDNKLEVVQLRTVSVVSMDAENNQITVMDDLYGEVVVNITDETTATANGEPVIGLYLDEGALIDIEYANFMTMSIPPQTNAVTIEVLNVPVEQSNAE